MNCRSGIILVFLTASLVFSSCSRSKRFAKDKKYYESEDKSYYYRGTTITKSQALASLGQPKKRILIFNFWNATPNKYKGIGIYAADELRRFMHVTKRVVIPQSNMSQLETERFVEGDRVRVAQLVREGRQFNAAMLVIGKIAKIVYRQSGPEVGLLRKVHSIASVDIELKLFDIQAGREIMAIGRSGEASSSAMAALEPSTLSDPRARSDLTKLAIRDAVRKFVQDVSRAVEKLEWQGKIAKILGSKVYVNAGLKSGLVTGDILKVLTPGDDIYDPDTGAYLGRTSGELKGTLEIVDFIGEDGGVAEMHTGGQFEQGDTVRLY